MIILEDYITSPSVPAVEQSCTSMGEKEPMVGRAEQNEIAIVPHVATLVLAGREGMVVLDQTVAPEAKEELVPQ
jgi:hypothetical protein